MRVALLTKEFPPEVYGGAGVYVEHLSAELKNILDLEVHAFGAERESSLVKRSYKAWKELTGDEDHFAALRTMSVDLAMAASVSGVDVVHSNTWYTNFAGHLSKLLHGIAHVVTTHSLEPLRPWKAEQLGGGYALSCFCEKTGLENADALIAVSEQMKKDVLTVYPAIDSARVHVVHNGVDPAVYRPDKQTDVIESLHIEPGAPLVTFLGRITRQKGLVHLLRAASNVDPNATVLICAGEADTPEIGAEVEKLVDELGKSRGNVVWADRMMERREAIQVLSHSSVFVCPSIYEPFGIVNLEAMACEAPVVATRTGGIPEVVADGETGLLVDVGPGGERSRPDFEYFENDLAGKINALLEDPARAVRMGKAGRARVLERFTWPLAAKKTAMVYELAAAAP
ncbi:MAG TPA: glycogen synthase [Actinomycetota bacterium]|nr:glycogen synthase [Actinomycetota bacterium]